VRRFGALRHRMLTTFGEDTRQEMCLGYIWFRYPLAGGL